MVAGGLMASALGGAAAPPSQAKAVSSAFPELAPSILEYLGDLDLAVAELANTWKPDDPVYRADVYQQIMMNLSYAYFALFTADPEHPDWSPVWNPVYRQQPNPDTIYLYAPMRGDLTYRVSGDRGTCHSVVIQTQENFAGFVDHPELSPIRVVDVNNMEVGPNGELEIIFSQKRPAGYTGNWAEITPRTNTMMVRYISQDWVNERDPQLSIECMDPVPPKPRLNPEEIIERIREMAIFPARLDRMSFNMQNDVKKRAGINNFIVETWDAVQFQAYWTAIFEFSPGEALILETDLPEVRPYWNLQINDPYFNIVEYVYRLSSTNGHFAKVSSDGKFRAVVALTDPGVPNWLDPAGFTEGALWGRWYDCSSTPKPTLKRVPFDKIRDYLPADTPHVTPEQRAEELRERVRACQRRRRW
jgi:hypothetical protein